MIGNHQALLTTKDGLACGTSASIGRAGWIVRSHHRSWVAGMRPSHGGADEMTCAMCLG